jgi:hypothetical protein
VAPLMFKVIPGSTVCGVGVFALDVQVKPMPLSSMRSICRRWLKWLLVQLKRVKAGPGMPLTTLGIAHGETCFAGIEVAFADVSPHLAADRAR